MFVCVCHAVNESAIRNAVDAGARSFRDLSFHTGCGTQCGSCVMMARGIMDEALTNAGLPESVVDLRVVSQG